MSVIDSLDKNKVRSSFALAVNTYDELAGLQRQVGLDLLDKFSVNCDDEIVLDVGCGTGFLTQQITFSAMVKQIFAIDLALTMAQKTQQKLPEVSVVCADAEYLPFAECSIDKIVSNVALQWCQNLVAVFSGFNKALKTDGQLVFSTFGPATLQELKQSWADVDDYYHVNSFFSIQQLLAFLQQAGFKDIQISSKLYQSNYPTVMALMRELKGIGAHNVLAGRNHKMTSKGQMQKMIDSYEKKRMNHLIPASYEIIFVSARSGQ